MSSKIEIWNLALLHVGSNAITSVDDDDKGAIALSRVYDMVRDRLIQEYPWSWAKARVKLSKSASAPDIGYEYAYTLPGDVLNAIKTNQPDYPFQRFGSTLEIDFDNSDAADDDEELFLTYVKRVEEGDYPPLFVEALALALAASIGKYMGATINAMEVLKRDAEMAIRSAFASDKRQDDTREEYNKEEDCTFISSRG
ncbi:MAG: hypothetical protein DRP56_07115 [Planctomycetota bacterium]|nr:MAG: hypothetical protein DRP56_07115 [Planctomycetota bacterium]